MSVPVPPSKGSPSIVADEVDDDAVALLGRRAFALGGVGAVLRGHALERLVDLGVGDLGGLARHLRGRRSRRARTSAAPRARPCRRGRPCASIAASTSSLSSGNSICGSRASFRLVVVDDLAVRLVDEVLQHVGHHRAAVDAAQMLHRHLARAEAVDPDLVLQARRARLVSRSSRSLAGSTTLNSRFRPSDSVSVTCMIRRAFAT